MAVNGVGRKPNQLHPTLGEFGLELGEGTKFSGADGRVIFGMGEQDDPFVANDCAGCQYVFPTRQSVLQLTIMEVDGPIGGLCLEIRCHRAKTEPGHSQVELFSSIKAEGKGELTVPGVLRKMPCSGFARERGRVVFLSCGR